MPLNSSRHATSAQANQASLIFCPVEPSAGASPWGPRSGVPENRRPDALHCEDGQGVPAPYRAVLRRRRTVTAATARRPLLREGLFYALRASEPALDPMT